MKRKLTVTIAAVVLAPWVSTGAATAAPSGTGVPEVVIGSQPRLVDPGHGTVKLVEESVATGERIYTGTLTSGVPVRVIQFESPTDEFETSDPVSDIEINSIDWIGTSSSSNPGLVDASISKNQVELPPEAMKPSLAAATTDRTVSLSWRTNGKRSVYQVFRDGRLLAENADGTFKEGGLTPNEAYEYKIVASGSISSAAGVQEKTLKVTTSGGSPRVKRAYQPYSNAIEYKTFIPDSRVSLDFAGAMSCGVVGKSGWTFGGDNRSYRAPTNAAPAGESQFRSFMWANVNWGNPDDQSLILLKAVGPTTRYHNGTYVDSRTASSTGMEFQEAYRSGSYAQVRFKHALGNPYCQIGSIQYNVMNRIYRSGLIEMVGWRFQAPAHEAYARFNPAGSDVWKTLVQRPNLGFHCLFTPACPVDSINISQTG